MEKHKVKYLQQLIQRRKNLSIEKLVLKLRDIEEKARECYSKSVHVHLDKDEFVEMLLLDGCFLIELIRKHWLRHWRAKDDDICEHGQMLSQIRHDVMLFENQLPLFVLNELFDMSKSNHPDDHMCHLVFQSMYGAFPFFKKAVKDSDILQSANHLLELVYRSCVSFSGKNTNFFESECHKDHEVLECINSASELKEAGIRLKRSKGETLLDVAYVGGCLEIPLLNVEDKTELILRNLIAYEQLCLPNDHPQYVSGYMFLMQCLVCSTKDIEVLRSCGIIENILGSDDSMCRIFNELGKNVYISSDHFYSDVFESVNEHYSPRYEIWMAKILKRRPWRHLPCYSA